MERRQQRAAVQRVAAAAPQVGRAGRVGKDVPARRVQRRRAGGVKRWSALVVAADELAEPGEDPVAGLLEAMRRLCELGHGAPGKLDVGGGDGGTGQEAREGRSRALHHVECHWQASRSLGS